NMDSMLQSFGPEVGEFMRKRTVYNAGILAGAPDYLRALSIALFLIAPGEKVPYCDQAAMNVVLACSPRLAACTKFASVLDGWALMAGPYADGEPIPVEEEPRFDGSFVRTANGKIYACVHQYDKVPEWNSYFLKKWSVI